MGCGVSTEVLPVSEPMMVEPSYERDGPTTEEVKKLLFDDSPNWACEGVSVKHIIDQVVDAQDRKEDGWGSYRGFYTFTFRSLVIDCKSKIC